MKTYMGYHELPLGLFTTRDCKQDLYLKTKNGWIGIKGACAGFVRDAPDKHGQDYDWYAPVDPKNVSFTV